VPTLQKADNDETICVATGDKPIGDLLSKEWLLTNECGGYASSTIVGCNTRRYHGLLIGSLNPLANRIMGLANCLEMVIFNGGRPSCGKLQNGNGGKVLNLSTFEFNGKFAPDGFKYLKGFRRDTGVHFDYQLDKLALTKSIYLLRDADAAALVYDFTGVGDHFRQGDNKTDSPEETIEFVLRPFIGLRDFHALQKSYARLYSAWLGDGLSVRHDVPGSCKLFLRCPSMSFVRDPQWWFSFVYRNDKERGQDFTEDLWSPGFFKCRLDSAIKIAFWASLRGPALQKGYKSRILSSCFKPKSTAGELNVDIKGVRQNLHRHEESTKRKAKSVKRDTGPGGRDGRYEMLCSAADQFIAKRQINGKHRTTVLAGFPWFADWGRDAFLSLPGLLLLTGRFEDAKSVLTTFAAAVDEGMIPNRFDDYGDTAYFNSIDASLWFINAAFQYLAATGDSETFTQQILPTIRWIVESFYNGTRFGIHADADGLITGGNEQTQLTWMDAKYDGVAFTARYGKAVEINALWYNDLCYLAQFYANRDPEASKHYKSMSDKVAASFSALFWNEKVGYLNDCVLPGGSADASLRPNQIFAVSLPFSPLSSQQQKRIVNVVKKHLLTPYGLRTLCAADSRYRGEYTGPQRERDEAYHQGTVWPYLIGPFVEAYLKVNDFSRKSKKKSAEFIRPLLEHLTGDGCLGQVCEIFDGDAPHKPRGCIAQAWSVAEVIRAYQLVNG
jgi:glycogen debranching enzyme